MPNMKVHKIYKNTMSSSFTQDGPEDLQLLVTNSAALVLLIYLPTPCPSQAQPLLSLFLFGTAAQLVAGLASIIYPHAYCGLVPSPKTAVV